MVRPVHVLVAGVLGTPKAPESSHFIDPLPVATPLLCILRCLLLQAREAWVKCTGHFDHQQKIFVARKRVLRPRSCGGMNRLFAMLRMMNTARLVTHPSVCPPLRLSRGSVVACAAFVTIELLEGETLAQRLSPGAIVGRCQRGGTSEGRKY